MFTVPPVFIEKMAMTTSISEYIPSGENESATNASLRRILKKVHASSFMSDTVLGASAKISAAFGKSITYVGDAAKSIM